MQDDVLIHSYAFLCFKHFSVLILNTVYRNRYNLHEQRLSGVLNNF